MNLQVATLAGGCFWCLEAVFEHVRGVQSVENGYSNGHAQSPTYEQVCRGDTGHAEVVRVTFDADVISFAQLLDIFFTIHDPTTLNRQGNDVGTQYRSGIYFHTPAQQAQAREALLDLERKHVYTDPIVTEVEPVRNYSAAERYHQHYFAQHPEQGYCAMVVAPKVEKFRKTFREFYIG